VVPQTVDDAKGKFDVARANQERNETLLSFTKNHGSVFWSHYQAVG